jgi:hypothetical protein
MKIKLLASITILCLCLVLPSLIYADNKIEFNSWTNNPGQFYVNRISESELLKTPSWTPEDGAPPLSITQAVEIARTYLKKKYPAYADAVVSEIKLDQFVIPQYFKNKWCYVVIFMKNVPVVNKPDAMNVLVMMDGKVNEPDLVKY